MRRIAILTMLTCLSILLPSCSVEDEDIVMLMQPTEPELITPNEIEHLVDEIIIDGQLEQRYDFVLYHFEKFGAYYMARTYLDDMETVSLFGPFKNRSNQNQKVDAPELQSEVMSYLKRRFFQIQILGDKGYIPIWVYGHGDIKLQP